MHTAKFFVRVATATRSLLNSQVSLPVHQSTRPQLARSCTRTPSHPTANTRKHFVVKSSDSQTHSLTASLTHERVHRVLRTRSRLGIPALWLSACVCALDESVVTTAGGWVVGGWRGRWERWVRTDKEVTHRLAESAFCEQQQLWLYRCLLIVNCTFFNILKF